MRRASRLVGGLALAAILATSATPAMAGRGWHGGWHGGHHQHRHHRHDDGFAAFLGLAAVIGAAAVIASSADGKAKTAPEEQAEDFPPEDASPPDNAHAAEEEAAVDDCAIAAREEASQDGHYAEVRDITGTQPTSDGGWEIDGTLDQRQGYRGQSRMRSFTCTWRDGQVADVVLDRDDIARRTPSRSDHSGISS